MTKIVFGPGFKSGRKLRTTRTVLQVAGGASPRRSPYTSGRLLHSHPDLLPVGNGPKVCSKSVCIDSTQGTTGLLTTEMVTDECLEGLPVG